MGSISVVAEKIHKRALEIATRYIQTDAELIEVLQDVDQHQVYLAYGYSSLFLYVTKELKLSESVAFNFIAVSRKAREIPALKEQIKTGAITLSNARKIAPVLTVQNQEEWLAKASALSNRQLEKEIVKVIPKAAVTERTSYVTPTRIRLEVGLSEDCMDKLRRTQDILSQARSSHASFEDAIEASLDEYLFRKDPLKKVMRRKTREIPTETLKTPVTLQVENRTPIPSAIRHQITLRDQGCCAYINDGGERCTQSRWIDIHHKIPVSEGGTNDPDNLITLCSAHHSWIHQNRSALNG
jgi:hypothetical protein